jgi:2-oxoisovalerate dehydrogenase E2 component (dihydrolipoyl transacylase)
MARYEFKLPDIGEGIAEAEIVAWHVKVGDQVEEDQQLADMMTDKATVEMETPVAGKVMELAGEVGDQVAIGSVLVVIETEAEASPARPERKDAVAFTDGLVEERPELAEAEPSMGEDRRGGNRRKGDDRRAEPREEPDRRDDDRRKGGDRRIEPREEPKRTPDRRSTPDKRSTRDKRSALASPAVRQRARDLGIDLAEVKTAGDRVRHSDLDAYLLYNGGSVSGRGTAPRSDETIKVVGLRRKIAENMQEAKRRIPHFTLVEEFDVSALEETRAMMNGDRGDNPKLTLLPFLITAMGKAIAQWPMLNATFDDDAMVVTRHGSMHLGMATQTEGGLMVPVIRDAQSKSVWQLASEILRLAEAARSGKASRDELTGSTITLSSLGPMGGITSTPVINRPEVAIIAVNKVEEKVVVVDGDIEVRKRMNLSLSCDHRVVDGWDAASFLQALKALIENPLRLLSA